MPIDRADPTTMAIAPSMSLALRSGIFCSAICRTWSCVTLPTVCLLRSAAPFGTPAAFFNKKLVGGVFVTKVKVRSA
jgi:hypothetical protein